MTAFLGDAADPESWKDFPKADLLLFDPPWPKARQGGTTVRLKTWFPVPGGFDGTGRDFDPIAPHAKEWYDWFRAVLRNARANLKDGGYVVICADDEFSDLAKPIVRSMFDYRNRWVWWKYPNGGNGMGYYGRRNHEYLLIATKGKPWQFVTKAGDVIPDVEDDVSVLAHQMVRGKGAYPTQKPVPLYVEVMERLCPPGGVVVDPAFGSGTAFVAARKTGRSCYGIDVNPDALTRLLSRLREEDPEHGGVDAASV